MLGYLPYLIFMFLIILKVQGINGNVTEFDDGGINFNITSNTIKYMTIPTDSSINNASLNITGFKDISYLSSISTQVINPYGISLIPGTTDFFMTNRSNYIFKVNATGHIIGNITTNITCNPTLLTYSNPHKFYGIQAVNSTHLLALNYNGSESPAMFLINFEGDKDHRCEKWWLFDFKQSTGTVRGFTANVSTDPSQTSTAYISERQTIGSIYKLEFNYSESTIQPLSTWKMSKTNMNTSWGYADLSISGTELMASNDMFNKLFIYDLANNNDLNLYKSIIATSSIDAQIITSTLGLFWNGTKFYFTETNADDEIAQFRYDYPKNFYITMNGSTLYSQLGLITDEQHIQLNKSLMQSYLESNGTIPFYFHTDLMGILQVEQPYIDYNNTQIAILNIISPTQITATVNSGDNYIQRNISITNTGDYNATQFDFYTVSGNGTPNYNESLLYSCSDTTIYQDSSILCNLTFISLTQNPEADERLRIKAIGTDINETVFSNAIDVDITVIQPTTGGGGGGGGTSFNRCNWKIYRPANLVIKSYGFKGYKTPEITFQIYNNESNKVAFSYSTKGIVCDLKYTLQNIEGSSFGLNSVQCKYPERYDTGQIVVNGGGCTSAINVELVSNDLGYLIILFSGNAGLTEAMIAWLVLIFVVGGIIKVISG